MFISLKRNYSVYSISDSYSPYRNRRNFSLVQLLLAFSFNFIMASTVESPQLSNGMSSFALDFYQKCADESIDQNIILSPLSVSSALALLSQGAQKNTFDQIVRGLHVNNDKMAMAIDFEKHYDSLNACIGDAILKIANQLYVQQGYQIQQSFHDVAIKRFKSNIESINFAETVNAAQTINSFVESKTNNKIKNLISPDALGADTRLVLVNAIYFKGNWEHKFPQSRTGPGDFYLDDTKTITVDFMRNDDDYRYAELDDLDASALELKYANSNISFVVVLPNSRTGLTALESALKNYDISKITSQMYKQKVEVTLPKFKIEYEIELNNVLQKLGMTEMFGNNADFGGLLDSPELLKVSKVIHKAFIEVNEEGAEAAAATGMIMMCRSMPFFQPFHAVHPFLFYILDSNTNTILFSGRCKEFD